MPFIDDILRGMQIQIDAFWYNLLLTIASLHWGILRAWIMMGYMIELLNGWLADNAFVPLIEQTNASLRVAVSIAFVVAMLVLGITYLLAVFVRVNVVEPRSAILWYIAGALFFSLGPSLYQGMADFRREVANAFYVSALDALQSTSGGTFDSLNNVESTDLGLVPLCDNLGTYLPGVGSAQSVDGLDVALAYLRADGIDIMGFHPSFRDGACQPHTPDPDTGAYTAGSIPWEWEHPGSYFDNTIQGVLYPILTDEQRQQSISMASASQGRLLMAWPLVLFGVAEQAVYLLLTIAQGITFVSFGVAILFAFFKKTEVIARSIVDQWIELIVQTVIIALMQSLVVAFFLAGTASGNGMVVLGIGLICLVFIVITLWSGIKAVWNSINRLFYAMGNAAGGTITSPAAATALAAAGGAAVVGGAVSLGANALAGATALSQGATFAQAAGSAAGGIPQLSGAARTLAYLPGVRGTSLGETAEQFTEGAVTRQVARHVPFVGRVTGPVLGTALLTSRDPDAAQYDDQDRVIARPMLVPAVGDALGSWTTPKGKRRNKNNLINDLDMLETEDGELIPTASSRPRRMGTFTPIPTQPPAHDEAETERARQKSEYAAEMQSEEMEQHISDTLRSSRGVYSSASESLRNADAQDPSKLDQVATRLEGSAEALTGAARLQMTSQTALGHLKLSGSADVASVISDVVRQMQLERNARGESIVGGLDHFSVADRMAEAMGVTPIGDKPSIQENLTRFGLYTDLALRLGLSPEQSEQVIREVKESPSGELQPETRQTLIEQVRHDHHLSWDDAEQAMNRLQNFGLALPEQIIAFGQMNIAIPSTNFSEIGNAVIKVAMPATNADSGDDISNSSAALDNSQSVLGDVS